MLIPNKHTLTSDVVGLLQQVEKLKVKLELLPTNPVLEGMHRQKSILKSSVYSARIEGNPTNFDQTSTEDVQTRVNNTKIELDNLRLALESVLGKPWKDDLTLGDINSLHEQVLKDLSSEAGKLRRERSSIYNMAGVEIYVCPPPDQIASLVHNLLDYVNSDRETIVPIKAGLAHFSFEKIHPFIDGNGRVGRLLVRMILKKYNYDLKGLVAFEEYIDKHKRAYYDLLASGKEDITDFVGFFLEGLVFSMKISIDESSNKEEIETEAVLPLRRQEILQIIRDHKQVSLDFIKRRFMAVSGRLLRYDLKKLQNGGFVRKRGVTRGVVYESV